MLPLHLLADDHRKTFRDALWDFVWLRFAKLDPGAKVLADWWETVPRGVSQAAEDYYADQLAAFDAAFHQETELQQHLEQHRKLVAVGLASGVKSGDDNLDIVVATAFFAATGWLICGRPNHHFGFTAATPDDKAFLGGAPREAKRDLFGGRTKLTVRYYWHAVRCLDEADAALLRKHGDIETEGPLRAWVESLEQINLDPDAVRYA